MLGYALFIRDFVATRSYMDSLKFVFWIAGFVAVWTAISYMLRMPQQKAVQTKQEYTCARVHILR